MTFSYMYSYRYTNTYIVWKLIGIWEVKSICQAFLHHVVLLKKRFRSLFRNEKSGMLPRKMCVALNLYVYLFAHMSPFITQLV